MKKFNYIINSLIFTLSIIVAIFVANMIVAKFDKRIDLTKNKTNTLAKESITTLKDLEKLDTPVKILFFPAPQNQTEANIAEETKVLLERIANESKNVTYEVVNPLKNKLLAEKYEIMYSGELVIEYGDNQSKISPNELFYIDQYGKYSYLGEQRVMQKVFDMTLKKKFNIYFTIGHNEPTVMDQLADLTNFLNRQGIGVGNIDLSREEISEDVDALFIVSPTSDFKDVELEKIDTYLLDGGNMMVTLPIYNKSHNTKNLQAFMKEKGVSIENNIALDPSRNYTRSYEVIVPTYGEHDITKQLIDSRFNSLAVASRTLTISDDSDYVITSLLNTSDKAWGETLNQDEDKDLKQDKNEKSGVLSLAAAMEKELKGDKTSRIVLLGSPLYITNEYGDFFNALYPFFSESLNWLDEDNVVLDIPFKENINKELKISKAQSDFIFFSIVIVIPAIIMIWGYALWYTRRNR